MKMVDIFQTTIQMHSLFITLYISNEKNHWGVYEGGIGNNSTLIQVTNCCRICDRPLFQSLIFDIEISDAI